jgi:hypothetical protein
MRANGRVALEGQSVCVDDARLGVCMSGLCGRRGLDIFR